jgi:DNA polymerase-3 subunit delta
LTICSRQRIISFPTTLNMILFIHGDDSFTSSQKIARLKQRFADTHGETNIASIRGDELLDAPGFRLLIFQAPLSGAKRMVIVKDFFAHSPSRELCREITQNLSEIPASTVLIFYESTRVSDTKNPLVQAMLKIARVEQCDPRTTSALKQWIRRTVESRGVTITPAGCDALIRAAGTDLWRLSNEIEKLTLLSQKENGQITEDHVRTAVSQEIHANIFGLIDAIGERNDLRACKELKNLRSNGEHALYILSMIAFQLRNLIQARDLLNRGKGKQELVRLAGLHPYTADKSLVQARTFTLEHLIDVHGRLVEIDRAAKSGLADPETALDQLVVHLCVR